MIQPLPLRGRVGLGSDNAPEDVLAVSAALANLGYLDETMPEAEPRADSKLDAGLRRYQKDRGLRVDGWLAPDGETARNLGRDLQGIDFRPKLAAADFKFEPIGPDRPSQPRDVAKVQKILAAAGFPTYDTTSEPDGWSTGLFYDEITRFQKTHGINPDGVVTPDGKTLAALTETIEETKPGSDETPTKVAAAIPLLPLLAIGALGVGAVTAKHAADGTREALARWPRDPDAPPKRGPGPATAGASRDPFAGIEIPSGTPLEVAKPKQDVWINELDDELGTVLRRDDNRGSAETVRTNNIVAEECRKVFDEQKPEIAKALDHIGGANKYGKPDTEADEKYLKEKEIKDDKIGVHNRADYTIQFGGDEGPAGHINTVTTRSDGTTLITRERRAVEQIARSVGEELIRTIPKLRKNYTPDDEERTRSQARKACQDLVKALIDKSGAKGEIEQQPSAGP